MGKRSVICRLLAGVACTSLLLAALAEPARADISGFTDFAAPNISGSSTSVGFNADRSGLTLTDGTRDIAVSAFDTHPQRVTSWKAQFTYQATGFGGPGASVAD